MTTLTIHGIVWVVNGRKDGKGIFDYQGCTVSYCKDMGCFQFKQGSNLILVRELRGDCLRDATHCILDSYANEFVPSWEVEDAFFQEEAA